MKQIYDFIFKRFNTSIKEYDMLEPTVDPLYVEYVHADGTTRYKKKEDGRDYNEEGQLIDS